MCAGGVVNQMTNEHQSLFPLSPETVKTEMHTAVLYISRPSLKSFSKMPLTWLTIKLLSAIRPFLKQCPHISANTDSSITWLSFDMRIPLTNKSLTTGFLRSHPPAHSFAPPPCFCQFEYPHRTEDNYRTVNAFVVWFDLLKQYMSKGNYFFIKRVELFPLL